MEIRCPASKKCWRYAYTVYFDRFGYEVPPTREVLLFSGVVGPDMLASEKIGIFANSLPLPGKDSGRCPDVRGCDFGRDCHEYQKFLRLTKHQNEWEKRRENQTPRVRNIPDEIRRKVAADAHYKCVYCGKAHGSRGEDGKPVRCVLDHFIPLALGGSNEASNLVFACRRCNQEKGAKIWAKNCKIKV